MKTATRIDPAVDTVGLDRDLSAAVVPAQPDPPVPVDGLTIGVARMSENAPHGGEMHPDGDEFLYLVSGRVRVVLESDPPQTLEVTPGQALIVPRGVWHRVDILEPSEIVYATPGPNNAFRPLE